MPGTTEPRNRGPAAAAGNRAAILAAAKELLAAQGFRVPMSAVARAAGVGQGVLYRHFPNRLELAYAAFADNFAELERLAAATPGPECFHVVWRQLVDYTVESSALVEMVIEMRAQLPTSVGEERLERLVAEPLARSQSAGLVDPSWTPQDILLLLQMVYGVVASSPDLATARSAVHRALTLVEPGLTPHPRAQPLGGSPSV